VVSTRVAGGPIARPEDPVWIEAAFVLASIHRAGEDEALQTTPAPRRACVAAGKEPVGFGAWLSLAALRPLPDPARWLPS
jgi:hypothetical protein